MSSACPGLAGARVQADRGGVWYLGNVVAAPAAPGGPWTVQCDADPPDTPSEAERVVVWVEPGGGCVFPGNPQYHYPDVRWERHDVPTAMAMVGRTPTLVGFNLRFVEGSRIEFRDPPGAGAWRKGRVARLPPAPGGAFRVAAAAGGGAAEVGPADLRYDMADTATVWDTVLVRRGRGRVSTIPAPPPAGHWTCLLPRAPLLPAGDPGLFDDGWSGDNARCRIVDRTTGPGNTRSTGSRFPVAWKRPGRGEGLADALAVALFKRVRSSDVEQGLLGNCWFLSAVAAVAEFPELVTRLFAGARKELDPHGRYVVRLWSLLEGRWRAHVIDDCLPVLRDSPVGLELAYAKTSSDDELWPCLLEKAMARHMGGYAAMDGGSSSFALGTLLGCPRHKLISAYHCSNGDWNLWKMKWSDDHASDPEWLDSTRFAADEFLDLLSTSRLSDFVMCAGTPGAASDPAQVGLSGGHVYSVLDVRRDVAGLGLDFLKFRDPNSYKLTPGWSGDWSQRSPLWGRHPEVARELRLASGGPAPGDDDEAWASFWMTYADACRYFGVVYIAAPDHDGPDRDDRGGAGATETGDPLVGARVHVQKAGVWYQGNIRGLVPGGEAGQGPWAVQCDADAPGALTHTSELLTWVEPGGTYFKDAEPGRHQIERARHDVPTAMALVLRDPDAAGFNLRLEVGSRVECKYRGEWVKGRVAELPGPGHEGAYRVCGACDKHGAFELFTPRIRYDMSDTATVWDTMIVRKGTPRVSAMPAASAGGYWTCLMPKSGALWSSFCDRPASGEA